MLNEERVQRAAQILGDCRLSGKNIDALPKLCRPKNELEGYLVQEVLHEYISHQNCDQVIGHKIGCTTPVMQKFLDIKNPCAGAVFGRSVHEREGSFGHQNYRHVGVECEIAVRIGSPLGKKGELYDIDEVTKSVSEIMAAIEVVDDRYTNYKTLGAPTLLADDFFNAGCVLGHSVKDWRSLDLLNTSGVMRINGKEVGRGTGRDIMGQPMNALAWLANLFGSRGKCIDEGEFILLGSVVEAKWVEVGDIVEVEVKGLGGAKAIFC